MHKSAFSFFSYITIAVILFFQHVIILIMQRMIETGYYLLLYSK